MKTDDHLHSPPLISARQIQRRIPQLAHLIHQSFSSEPDWAIIAILNGSYVFLADLGRALHKLGLTPPIDFLSLSSYGSGTSSLGKVKVERLFKLTVHNRAILLVDDILDSGRTLAYACHLLKSQGARVVRSCVLLEKEAPRAGHSQADFVGFPVPNRFVVGYGLDGNLRYRNLSHIAYLDSPS